MTCIVGVKTREGVFIGGDSAAVDESGSQLTLASGKVFFVGDQDTRLLLGCTASGRMMQLLRYELQVPPCEKGMEAEEYIVTKLINAVRTCLKEGGFAQRENEREAGGHFLVAFQGRLFEVDGDYQVDESTSDYAAIGSGGPFALGALYATAHFPPRERIEYALQAATCHNAYVKPPYSVLCLPFSAE